MADTYTNGNGLIPDESIQTTALSDYALEQLNSGYRIIDVPELSIADNTGQNILYQKGRAGKWKLEKAIFELTEVPDLATTTMTVTVNDGTNAALSAAVTFTAGTDAVGKVEYGTPNTDNTEIFNTTESIQVLIGGTSATLGKLKGRLIFIELP